MTALVQAKPIELGPAATLSPALREAMIRAGEQIVDIAGELAGEGANVVSELLKAEDGFLEWRHYPKGDAFDTETCAQYYYHSHDGTAEEHGHFHTFLRAGGMPPGVAPQPHSGSDAEDWPSDDDALSHLVGIRMDHHGIPTHLFTTNRWVTGETFYPAADVRHMVGRFAIECDHPSRRTNRWISAMLVLFRPQIDTLLDQRDAAITERGGAHEKAGTDIFEDRDLDITSICRISVADQLDWLGLLD